MVIGWWIVAFLPSETLLNGARTEKMTTQGCTTSVISVINMFLHWEISWGMVLVNP